MKAHYTAAFFVAVAAITVLLSFFLAFRSIRQEDNKIYNPSTKLTKTNSAPAVVPLTQTEVDNVLLNNDTDIQISLNQIDQDTNELNSIDMTLDSQGL